MLKKTCAFILAAAMVALTGCASIIDGDYSHSAVHETFPQSSSDEADKTVDVSTQNELYDAVAAFTEECVEYGKIRFVSYPGDIESDVSSVCMEVANETPIGAYAVYYINYSISKIVSYYEADISITYKRSAEEIRSVIEITDIDELSDRFLDIMSGVESTVAFCTYDHVATADYVSKCIENVYYDNPESIPYLPSAEISVYPSDTFPCIIHVNFTYPYSTNIIENRISGLKNQADTVLRGAGDLTDDEAVSYLCDYLRSTVTFDSARASSNDYNRWYNSCTAYGALLQKKAIGEGYAMALKLLCDKSGIECYVVRGLLNNLSHSWNIVKLENGSYYHVDASDISDGCNFFTDEEFSAKYHWDTFSYVRCDGESLRPESQTDTENVESDSNNSAETGADISQSTTQSETVPAVQGSAE